MVNKFYTSVSKGGEYELLGASSGAGKLKGFPLMVYRDTTTGKLYHREPEDFAVRMKAVQPQEKASDLLKELLTAMAESDGFDGLDAIVQKATAFVEKQAQ